MANIPIEVEEIEELMKCQEELEYLFAQNRQIVFGARTSILFDKSPMASGPRILFWF